MAAKDKFQQQLREVYDKLIILEPSQPRNQHFVELKVFLKTLIDNKQSYFNPSQINNFFKKLTTFLNSELLAGNSKNFFTFFKGHSKTAQNIE